MNLIYVDVIRAQPPQRIVNLAHDAFAAGIAEGLSVPPIDAGLGGDDHARARANAGNRSSNDLLRTAEPVGRRRVDDVDAAVQSGPYRRDRLSFVGAAPHPTPDCPGPERHA